MGADVEWNVNSILSSGPNRYMTRNVTFLAGYATSYCIMPGVFLAAGVTEATKGRTVAGIFRD